MHFAGRLQLDAISEKVEKLHWSVDLGFKSVLAQLDRVEARGGG